jgi:hypothetical protein
VLEAVHRIGLVRFEIRQDPKEQIGQLPDVLFVHPGEHRKILIGSLVHPPEVHLADVIRHTVSSFQYHCAAQSRYVVRKRKDLQPVWEQSYPHAGRIPFL